MRTRRIVMSVLLVLLVSAHAAPARASSGVMLPRELLPLGTEILVRATVTRVGPVRLGGALGLGVPVGAFRLHPRTPVRVRVEQVPARRPVFSPGGTALLRDVVAGDEMRIVTPGGIHRGADGATHAVGPGTSLREGDRVVLFLTAVHQDHRWTEVRLVGEQHGVYAADDASARDFLGWAAEAVNEASGPPAGGDDLQRLANGSGL